MEKVQNSLKITNFYAQQNSAEKKSADIETVAF